MNEDLRAFQMAEELMTETEAPVRTLDQARDVRNDEAALVVEAHDAKVRRQRGERIVRNLRPGRRDVRDQRRFAGVRKSDEPDIRKQLQLEAEVLDFTGFSRLHLARRAVRRGCEPGVAHAALPAARNEHALIVLGKIGHQPERVIGIPGLFVHERAHRHVEHEVLAGPSGAVRSFAVIAAVG